MLYPKEDASQSLVEAENAEYSLQGMLEFAIQICDGMDYLHTLGQAHIDM